MASSWSTRRATGSTDPVSPDRRPGAGLTGGGGEGFSIRPGFAPEQRADAARIYWDAFGQKLGRVLGPEPLALAYLQLVLRADHCICAESDTGRLLGIAGFKSPKGAFAGGTDADMRAVYGRAGALWRKLLLWLLSGDIDNHRFLIDGIAVSAKARGAGIGTALLTALCQEAEQRGYQVIRLEVVAENPRARALYEREGFVPAGEEHMGPLRHIFGFAAVTTMLRVLR